MGLEKIQEKSTGVVPLDRLTSLPAEILSCSILSLLPTKDAVVASVVSKKMRHAFRAITYLDFEVLPMLDHEAESDPDVPERFEKFYDFVDNILDGFLSPCVSVFRLKFGSGEDFLDQIGFRFYRRFVGGCDPYRPNFGPDSRLNGWLCFPFTRSGVREIDLRIHVRKAPQLPQEIFECETLEVLKLDVNLKYDRVSAMPSFRLPRLTVLQIRWGIFPDGFLTRLVSSCPRLEELTVERCWWKDGNVISISSPSLRTVVLDIFYMQGWKNSDNVVIDAPNLQSIDYFDNLALRYCIKPVNALVRADIGVHHALRNDPGEGSCQSALSLVRAFSNVRHLSLSDRCIQALQDGDLKDKLPVFRNLKQLELGSTWYQWGQELLELLNCSPILETLVFPRGLIEGSDNEEDEKVLKAERELFNPIQVISCSSHLKRIEIAGWSKSKREVNLVKFLLRNALVSEELVVWLLTNELDPESVKSTLNKLPRASINCSIQVR